MVRSTTLDDDGRASNTNHRALAPREQPGRYGIGVSDQHVNSNETVEPGRDRAGEVYVAGEALIDLVAEPDGRYRAVPGGSPANVAVGLARLGAPTHLLARLGSGAFGRVIREHLAANDVLLDAAVSTSDPTTLAVVTLDDEARATYDFYADGTADWGWTEAELPTQLPPEALALVTGSIAAAREPGATALLELVRRVRGQDGASIVLDPNLRPALLPTRAQVQARWDELIALADVVKVSDEDLAWLVPGTDPVDVAAGWAARGPALVVVTLGAAGAHAVTSTGATVEVAARPVDVADTVGAGDAFTSGLVDSLRLAGLLGRRHRDRLDTAGLATLRPILDRAALTAALTCTRVGADPPTAEELAGSL